MPGEPARDPEFFDSVIAPAARPSFKELSVSKPTDAPSGAPDRDPVQEVRAHLEQALASLDRLHEVLPATSCTPPDAGGGESA